MLTHGRNIQYSKYRIYRWVCNWKGTTDPTSQRASDPQRQYFGDQGAQKLKIKAQDQLVDVNQTGGLPKELEVFVEAKVISISNIDISVS